MDDDVRQALDEIRERMHDLSEAATPRQRDESRRELRSARVDLEQALRQEGYHVSRDELTQLVEDRDYRRFRAYFDRMMDELDPPAADPAAADPAATPDAAAKKTGRPKKTDAAAADPADADPDREWL